MQKGNHELREGNPVLGGTLLTCLYFLNRLGCTIIDQLEQS